MGKDRWDTFGCAVRVFVGKHGCIRPLENQSSRVAKHSDRRVDKRADINRGCSAMEQMDVFSDRSGAFYALIRCSGAALTRSLGTRLRLVPHKLPNRRYKESVHFSDKRVAQE